MKLLHGMKPEELAESVIAVPPLARTRDGEIDRIENRKLLRHLEHGGVSTVLYGGNANLYHIAPSQYGKLLEVIAEDSSDQTIVIPAVGPTFGVMMDQAPMLSSFGFPTVMVMPMTGMTTSAGVATGIRRFVEALGKPVVLYLKTDDYCSPSDTRSLVDDGLVSWIKYAVVREDPGKDELLRELTDCVDPQLMVSGIGEQPAIIHMREFGLQSYTSGCICVAPALSQAMLVAIRSGDWKTAESIRGIFKPLEDLRNRIHPVRVLHEAVRLAGIADTGPALPLLSNLDPDELPEIEMAVSQLCNVAMPR